MTPPTSSILERLARVPAHQRAEILAGLPDEVVAQLTTDWRAIARPNQLPPEPNTWTTWLFAAGRGAGKTRTAAEWCHEGILEHYARGEEIGHTTYYLSAAGRAAPDVRDIIVEGESGLMAVAEARGLAAKYEPSKRRITWPDLASQCLLFSAEEPDQARGPQSHRMWADEVAAWDLNKTDSVGNNLWTNLKFGLRLGAHPQAIATTTPKRVPLIKELIKQGRDPNDRSVALTTGSMMENAANLAPSFLEEVIGKYEGTSLYDQEVLGLLIGDDDLALWDDKMINRAHRFDHRPDQIPKIAKKLVAVDPPKTSTGDLCGIVVVGLLANPLPGLKHRCAIVLEDYSTRGSPDRWGRKVVTAAYNHSIRRVVVEGNQGGEMAWDVIKNRDENSTLEVELVDAMVSKELRAEPVSQLYEQGRVIHEVEGLKDLEEEMLDFEQGLGHSPDRLDAMVHGITALLPELNQRPSTISSPLAHRIDRNRGLSGNDFARLVSKASRDRLTTSRLRNPRPDPTRII